MQAASTPPELLRTYLHGSIAFMRDHRSQLIAMLEIATGGNRSELQPGLEAISKGVSALEDILRSGQRSGDFRQFDPRVMARAIRNVVDGVPHHMLADPDLDLDAYSREIITLFTLATRNQRA
jgi:hypothetical protein